MQSLKLDKEDEYKNIDMPTAFKYLSVALLIAILLLTLFLLFVVLAGNPSETAKIIEGGLLIAYLFLYIILLLFANDRKKYVLNNWWLLLAAFPLELLSPDNGIALAVLNALLVIRLLLRVTILVRISRRLIPKSYTLLSVTALASTLLFSTALFYNFEYELNDSVNSYFDSFWWSVVTGTTVGYGDIVPVTNGGRVIGIILMFIGIGVFGAVTGVVASLLTNRAKNIIE